MSIEPLRKYRMNPMRSRLGVALLAATALGGCELDLDNPNSPTEQEVLTSTEGVIALGVGLQGLYASNVLVFTRAPALVTDEWGTQTRALQADQALFTGQGLDASFGVVEAPYAGVYQVVRAAEKLMEAVPQVQISGGLRAGLLATAKLYKAMALGVGIQHYERVPITVALEGAPLQDRATVFAEVIRLLEEARAELEDVSDAELEQFRAQVSGPDIDLRSTINAMLARYSLYAGCNEQAIEAADRVNLEKLSAFTYPGVQINPLFNYSLVALYTAGLKSFADQAQPGDQRPAYWLDVDGPVLVGNPDSLLLPLRQYSTRNDPYPVYLPDEVRLIQAEAYTQLGNFERARELINEVRTQCSSALPEPLACLPALPAEALDTRDELFREIAYERAYELYMQGIRWEDTRRLDPYIDVEPTFLFLPLPQRECLTNPQAGCGG
jgi:tetratricopeptide (TPR) repeat protein